MFMKQNYEFGVTTNVQRNVNKVAYCNSFRLLQNEYYVPNTGCAIDRSNKLAILKSYNEFLERFRLGIGGFDRNNIYITYGNNYDYGVIDTTGTASGKISRNLIYKSSTELIEKNEIFLFWYTKSPFFIVEQNNETKSLIESLNFIAESHMIFCLRNISNVYTILSLSFKEDMLTGCGVAADLDFNIALKKSILENKLIEWQNYKNPNSDFYLNAKNKKVEIINFLNSKVKQNNRILLNKKREKENEIIFESWISNLEIVFLGKNISDNIKTIKMVSKDLLNCLPSNKNIQLSRKQTIIKSFNIINKLDCIIV